MDDPRPLFEWPSYISWMLGTMIAFVVAVAAFNILIDPLGVFQSPRVVGLNAIKPHLDHQRELARWVAARRLCPNAGIFGNSRAEIGFDPSSQLFVERGLTGFNHAIPGTGASLSLRQIGWLEAAGCMPKTILLGVEFFDYLGSSASTTAAMPESAPAPRVDARFVSESVLSINGLRDSISTVLLQSARNPATLTDRGFNPLYNYIAEVQQSGHYVLFRQRAEENVRNWSRATRRIRPAGGGASDDEQALDGILNKAGSAGSTVHLIIYPYHAQTRLIIERLGLGGLFGEWKKLIVAIASRHASEGGKVTVWDFSGIAPETLEAIPLPGDRRTQMKYYWEGGHFKKALGDLAIARVFGAHNGFGVEVDSTNIDNWIAADRDRVLTLLASPSPLVSGVNDNPAFNLTQGRRSGP